MEQPDSVHKAPHPLVFIDESGDAGLKFEENSSPYFIVKAVRFDVREESYRCLKAIDSLRVELRVSPKMEFHFNKCSHAFRIRFLERVAPFQFTYSFVQIDKRKMLFPTTAKQPQILNRFAEIASTELQPESQGSHVTADQSSSGGFGELMIKQIRSRILSRDKINLKLRTERSHSNSLIQLAEMVCGAVSRVQRAGRDRKEDFWTIIKGKESRRIIT